MWLENSKEIKHEIANIIERANTCLFHMRLTQLADFDLAIKALKAMYTDQIEIGNKFNDYLETIRELLAFDMMNSCIKPELYNFTLYLVQQSPKHIALGQHLNQSCIAFNPNTTNFYIYDRNEWRDANVDSVSKEIFKDIFSEHFKAMIVDKELIHTSTVNYFLNLIKRKILSRINQLENYSEADKTRIIRENIAEQKMSKAYNKKIADTYVQGPLEAFLISHITHLNNDSINRIVEENVLAIKKLSLVMEKFLIDEKAIINPTQPFYLNYFLLHSHDVGILLQNSDLSFEMFSQLPEDLLNLLLQNSSLYNRLYKHGVRWGTLMHSDFSIEEITAILSSEVIFKLKDELHITWSQLIDLHQSLRSALLLNINLASQLNKLNITKNNIDQFSHDLFLLISDNIDFFILLHDKYNVSIRQLIALFPTIKDLQKLSDHLTVLIELIEKECTAINVIKHIAPEVKVLTVVDMLGRTEHGREWLSTHNIFDISTDIIRLIAPFTVQEYLKLFQYIAFDQLIMLPMPTLELISSLTIFGLSQHNYSQLESIMNELSFADIIAIPEATLRMLSADSLNFETIVFIANHFQVPIMQILTLPHEFIVDLIFNNNNIITLVRLEPNTTFDDIINYSDEEWLAALDRVKQYHLSKVEKKEPENPRWGETEEESNGEVSTFSSGLTTFTQPRQLPLTEPREESLCHFKGGR